MEEDLKKAMTVIRRGGIILYPTDTVWGIGCDATRSEAVRRIYALKQRPDAQAMLVLIDSADYLPHYVDRLPDVAWELARIASGRPLTIIYSGARNVAPELMAADGSLGIRVTREAFSQQLCRRLKRPVVSTSANISGRATPATFAEIDGEILRGVDYVVGYRQEERQAQEASSVLRLSAEGIVNIIRP
jgi:L-threonylcarbamoyladenylate synthase